MEKNILKLKQTFYISVMCFVILMKVCFEVENKKGKHQNNQRKMVFVSDLKNIWHLLSLAVYEKNILKLRHHLIL